MDTQKTIYKYPLEIKDEQTVMLPQGAQILSVANIRGQICLYALVNPESPSEIHRIAMFGTGGPFWATSLVKFIGTVGYHNESLVFHIFELL